MRKVAISFSGKAYDATTAILVERALPFGAEECWIFDDKWLIDSGYYETNRWLFEATSRIQNEPTVYKHGFAWCSWKSFIVLSALDRMQDGDCAFYIDADCYPIAPFGHLFDKCAAEGGVLLFDEQVSNLRFTKADCMVAMGLPVADGKHACGRFSLWQKGSFLARQMLAEWWAYSINPRCTLWDTSILVPDPPEYYRNSTEQSVLSNLAIKYGLPLHPSPDLPGTDHQLFEQVWCSGNRADLSGSSYRNV